MQAVHVNIQPEILIWVLNQAQEDVLGIKWVDNIRQWIAGTKIPTFRQIETVSKKTKIPLGYFFLLKPPKEQFELMEYRTIESKELHSPSRNLIDTIQEMEMIQDWMRNYRKDLGYDILPFVGKGKKCFDKEEIAMKIRNYLGVQDCWYEKCNTMRDAFQFIRNKLEESGILVMMNGVVGKNTHRKLDVNEFRAFAMADDWAPLIFINASDSQGARIFSLLHEAVHIWMGEDDLFNDRKHSTEGLREIEIICNAVAGELLVPQHKFIKKWKEVNHVEDVLSHVTELSKYFHCSEAVIARKALDNKKIDKSMYRQIVKKTIENYQEQKEREKNTGGNYYNTMGSRLDGCFVRAIFESVKMGRISYTEAYRLTNTSRKTFLEVVKRLGVREDG